MIGYKIGLAITGGLLSSRAVNGSWDLLVKWLNYHGNFMSGSLILIKNELIEFRAKPIVGLVDERDANAAMFELLNYKVGFGILDAFKACIFSKNPSLVEYDHLVYCSLNMHQRVR
ncbi:hypothetical protein WL58_09210 [Burkholderia cepacia]|nr:hypothetical protein WL58_09210 [Burkholderia cepacia]RQT56904.1 hypothetical protein DF050_07000 [Burkholderia cepacia]